MRHKLVFNFIDTPSTHIEFSPESGIRASVSLMPRQRYILIEATVLGSIRLDKLLPLSRESLWGGEDGKQFYLQSVDLHVNGVFLQTYSGFFNAAYRLENMSTGEMREIVRCDIL